MEPLGAGEGAVSFALQYVPLGPRILSFLLFLFSGNSSSCFFFFFLCGPNLDSNMSYKLRQIQSNSAVIKDVKKIEDYIEFKEMPRRRTDVL
jgi:hypothetical protein